MQLMVITNDALQAELCAQGTPSDCRFINSLDEQFSADVIIDLLYDGSEERLNKLKHQGRLVIINSVIEIVSETDPSVIRINGWPTFLKGQIIEGASATDAKRKEVEAIFASFGKTIRWVPNIPGFLTPRVVGMIINEAHSALAQEISTKEEIDTAMKLGTNYPYGPFEWCEHIGYENVRSLLQRLSNEDGRYQPFLK